MSPPLLAAEAPRETSVAAAWAGGLAGPLRLEDGRALRVIFPGVPGGGAGPDFVDALLDVGGDILRGPVELHLRTSGWRQHGHHLDPAYAGVVLHVVADNDLAGLVTLHASGRAIPLLVLPSSIEAAGEAFVPPCAFAVARGADLSATLGRLGLRRIRAKAARAAIISGSRGPAGALYTLLLETCGGPSNRAAFGSLAARLPLEALLERSEGHPDRALACTAALRAVAAQLVLQRAGLRPMASPARRIELAGRLVARLWRDGVVGWPESLVPADRWRPLAAAGASRSLAIELVVNAVLPVATATGAWSEAEVAGALQALPTPGTYGKLRRLESWIGREGDSQPFRSAAELQGGLLLHADYCARGRCGRCPLSS